jgi:hypothetical protein
MTPEELKNEERIKELNKELTESFRRFDSSLLKLVHSNGAVVGSTEQARNIHAVIAVGMFVVGQIWVGGILVVVAGLFHYCKSSAQKRFDKLLAEHSIIPPKE